MQVSNNVAGVSFIVLQEMLGMSPVSLWTCPSCIPEVLPKCVVASPHYSWAVVLVCGVCGTTWMVCKECRRARVRFTSAADALGHHRHKHRIVLPVPVQVADVACDRIESSSSPCANSRGSCNRDSTPSNVLIASPSVASIDMDSDGPIMSGERVVSPRCDVLDADVVAESLLSLERNVYSISECFGRDENVVMVAEPDVPPPVGNEVEKGFSSGINVSDVSESLESLSCSYLSKSVQTMDASPCPYLQDCSTVKDKRDSLFTFSEENAHRFILIEIPVHLLEAMYEAASLLPIKQFEVISSPLKQLRLYGSFHRLFPPGKNLCEELFGVLHESFFKYHPYLDSSEANATVLVTDGPMVEPQQPHMDYCWETILLPSRREARGNRAKVLCGTSRIPFTGHLPVSPDGSYIYLWSGPGVGVPFYIEYGKMLIIRGDVVHSGGVPPSVLSEAKLYHRVQFYFPILPTDIPGNAIYVTNFDSESFSRDYVL